MVTSTLCFFRAPGVYRLQRLRRAVEVFSFRSLMIQVRRTNRAATAVSTDRYLVSLTFVPRCYPRSFARSLVHAIRLRLSDRGRQLAVGPRVFAVLIAGPAVSYKCPLSREPRVANRASARGTLSNYLRKPSLCRVIYAALLRHPDARASFELFAQGFATEIRFLLCHRPARYVNVTTGRFACSDNWMALGRERSANFSFAGVLSFDSVSRCFTHPEVTVITLDLKTSSEILQICRGDQDYRSQRRVTRYIYISQNKRDRKILSNKTLRRNGCLLFRQLRSIFIIL